MPVSPQSVVMAVQAVTRLGHAARRAYQDHVVDSPVALPAVDVAQPAAPARAAQIVRRAMQRGTLDPAVWARDFDLVAAGDRSPEGLAAQTRIVAVAERIDPQFAARHTEESLTLLSQWSDEANRATPLGRIGIELAEITLEYLAASPGLFGADGNGTRFATAVATSLADLLPDPDDPGAESGAFASGAVRIFVEAGLRALNRNIAHSVAEPHLRELARSTLAPLIDAVAAGEGGDQPWYDLRDEFLGPVAEAAIDVLARHQAGLLGEHLAVTTRMGALTHAVLIAVKDDGLADDFGTAGLIRVYRALLDTVVRRHETLLGEPEAGARTLTRGLLIDTAEVLRANSPPFDRALGVALVASTLDAVSEHAAVLVTEADLEDWTGPVSRIGAVLVREIAEGLREGSAPGGDARAIRRLLGGGQGARLLEVLVEEIAATPGMISANAAPEVRLLAAILARAATREGSTLLTTADWLSVFRTVAREVAANPGRLIDTTAGPVEAQLLFQLLRTVLDAAADAGGRSDGNLLFGETLARIVCITVQVAAGNAGPAGVHVERLALFLHRLLDFARSRRDRVGRRVVLALFREFVDAVIETGELPEFDAVLLDALSRPAPEGEA